ncbi:MAG TPA: DUF1993 domain-containing protein [Xanthomonadaceae bacterium]|nr:DUF1993 domain-containing protein [Xanthomonadaceae bacterium]
MPFSRYQASVPVLLHGLQQLSHLLDKARAHAQAQGIAPEILIDARLAADMLPLSAQVQRSCDTAKLSVQRLSDVPAPKMDDTERSFDELQARIAATADYLRSVEPASMDTDRRITLRFGKQQAGFDSTGYLTQFALPNFFFHVTTAYAILRHQGVALGKLDYLGAIGTPAALE